MCLFGGIRLGQAVDLLSQLKKVKPTYPPFCRGISRLSSVVTGERRGLHPHALFLGFIGLLFNGGLRCSDAGDGHAEG